MSLINDEFHKVSPSHPHQRVYGVSPSLADNRMSGREKVVQERVCRICASRSDMTRHHLIPLSWFLSERGAHLRSIRNANANIVPLCEACHRLVDGVRDPVLRFKKRAALRERLGSNEVAFIIQVRGLAWINEHYPRNP